MKTEPSIKSKETYNFWIQSLSNSVDWQSKYCVYHKEIFKYVTVPEFGDIVMLGTGYGLAFERLCNQFFYRTVLGYDIYNYANHPNVIEKDVRTLKDTPIAWVTCNAGNFIDTPNLRYDSLKWCLKNLVSGGKCLTAGNHDFVENYLGFSIKNIADEYNCSVHSVPLTKNIIKMNETGHYNSIHDCLIIKK